MQGVAEHLPAAQDPSCGLEPVRTCGWRLHTAALDRGSQERCGNSWGHPESNGCPCRVGTAKSWACRDSAAGISLPGPSLHSLTTRAAGSIARPPRQASGGLAFDVKGGLNHPSRDAPHNYCRHPKRARRATFRYTVWGGTVESRSDLRSAPVGVAHLLCRCLGYARRAPAVVARRTADFTAA